MFWMISTIVLFILVVLQQWRWVWNVNALRRYYDDRAIMDIRERGIEVFGDEAKFRRWLYSKIRALNNRKPIELLREIGGKDEILALLGRIEHGVYS